MKLAFVWMGAVLTLLAGACERDQQGVRQSDQKQTVATGKPVAASQPALSPENALRKRVEEYWQARVVEDYTTLYKFQQPEYRAEMTFDEYIQSVQEDAGLFRYSSFELGPVETMGQMGWVFIKAAGRLIRFPDLPSQTVDRVDTWRFAAGDWYPAMGDMRAKFPEPPSKRDLSEEGFLAKRFDEYFKAHKHADYSLLYQFLSPQSREAIPYDYFAESEKAWFKFLECNVLWTEVTGERGRVGAWYKYISGDPHLAKTEPLNKFMIESWVKQDGVWYRDVPTPKVDK